jgi:hypothetical protein
MECFYYRFASAPLPALGFGERRRNHFLKGSFPIAIPKGILWSISGTANTCPLSSNRSGLMPMTNENTHDDFTLDDIDFDAMLKTWEARKTRRNNPYALHLIEILYPHGERGLLIRFVYDRIRRRRVDLGLPIPRTFEETVRSAYNAQCELSDVLTRDPSEALFYPVGGKRSGRWAVHRDRIRPWINNRQISSAWVGGEAPPNRDETP